MVTKTAILPASQRALPTARDVLDAAMRENAARGDEALGFLSDSHGFLPKEDPRHALPASHAAWDRLAEELPDLFGTLQARRAVEALPTLPATRDVLPDADLCRASAVLAILAHAWARVTPEPPLRPVPDCVRLPWEEVTRRLQRPSPVLSYVDLVLYNWKRVAGAGPIVVENLDLLIPTVGNQEERVFYNAQVEVIATCTPAVAALVRAETAIAARDDAALAVELEAMAACLRRAADHSFQKIDPNVFAKTAVHPVVWAKTVAPFAVPLAGGRIGADGTAAPIFHAMDAFTGRTARQSKVADTARKVREVAPPHWNAFVGALERVNARAFVEASGSSRVKGLFRELMEAYAGDKGLLAAHRLKAYGFIEVAFKAGRSVTIAGFEGAFKDRTWTASDDALEDARLERHHGLSMGCPVATISHGESGGGRVARASLALGEQGVVYAPGDRCAVLPENEPALIDRTLRALRARGNEPVELDGTWRAFAKSRPEIGTSLPLRDLLKYGTIRPLARSIAKLLVAATSSQALARIVEARREGELELWDALELVAASGFDVTSLWKARPWDRESITKIVPPERFRLYSIASAPTAEGTLDLAVGALTYRTQSADGARHEDRHGATSSFLHRMVAAPARLGFPVRVVTAPRFRLPEDDATPVLMFAGGAGIAPFRGFLQARLDVTPAPATNNWLFFAGQDAASLPFRREIARWVASRGLRFVHAFSREDASLELLPDGSDFRVVPGARRRIQAAIREHANTIVQLLLPEDAGGHDAIVYVCGRTGFALSVYTALQAELTRRAPQRHLEDRERHARDQLFRLAAERRLVFDVFSTYEPARREEQRSFDASEVVAHNTPASTWTIIDGRVYDMTDFAMLHPGGDLIVRAYGGIDATAAYRAVLHDLNPEVHALLGMYEIGTIRRLNFGAAWTVTAEAVGLSVLTIAEAFRRWVRLTFTVVEMENAAFADETILGRSLTRGDDPTELTPLKMQLLIENLRRFQRSYADEIGSNLAVEAWRIAVGLAKLDAHPVDWMRQRVGEAGAVGSRAREIPDQLRRALETLVARGVTGEAMDQLRAVVLRLLVLAKQLLADIKALFRDGLRIFEELQAGAATGAPLLVAMLQRLPHLLERVDAEMIKTSRGFEATA